VRMMKTPAAVRSFRRRVLMGALMAACHSVGFACIQGSKFHPPAPRLAPPAVAGVDGLALPKPDVALPALIDLEAVLKVQITAGKETEAYSRYVAEFEARPPGPASLADATDYAVALIRLGRPAEAIPGLLALEKERPGAYATAANLGTAYELADDLPEAARWIAEGIRRNPASHDGTEWLHLAILRAKMALRRDAGWLARHTVLENTGARAPAEIVRAIEYQLAERLQFVKPADAVVCDLFFQAARLASGAEAETKRAFFLREARRFGGWRKDEAVALEKS
jgi:hypothetical protein